MKDRRVKTIAFILIFVVIALTITFGVYNHYRNRSFPVPPISSAEVFYPHIWVNSTGSLAAFILNYWGEMGEAAGPTYVDNIAVNGVQCPWSEVYYWSVPKGVEINAVRKSIHVSKTAMTTAEDSFNLTIAYEKRAFTVANSDIPISPYQWLLVYIQAPANITEDDIGTNANITCYLANGLIAGSGYHGLPLCIVESATPTSYRFLDRAKIRIGPYVIQRDFRYAVGNDSESPVNMLGFAYPGGYAHTDISEDNYTYSLDVGVAIVSPNTKYNVTLYKKQGSAWIPVDSLYVKQGNDPSVGDHAILTWDIGASRSSRDYTLYKVEIETYT